MQQTGMMRRAQQPPATIPVASAAGLKTQRVDGFLDKTSPLGLAYLWAAYGCGGCLLGLVIHSFPLFRWGGVLTSIVLLVALFLCFSFKPLLQALAPVYGAGARAGRRIDERRSALNRAIYEGGLPSIALLVSILAGVALGMM